LTEQPNSRTFATLLQKVTFSQLLQNLILQLIRNKKQNDGVT